MRTTIFCVACGPRCSGRPRSASGTSTSNWAHSQQRSAQSTTSSGSPTIRCPAYHSPVRASRGWSTHTASARGGAAPAHEPRVDHQVGFRAVFFQRQVCLIDLQPRRTCRRLSACWCHQNLRHWHGRDQVECEVRQRQRGDRRIGQRLCWSWLDHLYAGARITGDGLVGPGTEGQTDADVAPHRRRPPGWAGSARGTPAVRQRARWDQGPGSARVAADWAAVGARPVVARQAAPGLPSGVAAPAPGGACQKPYHQAGTR